MTLTGLLSGTSYYFRAGSTDAAGNGLNPSAEFVFKTTGGVPDTTAPQITSPPTVTSITNSSAVVQWTTDEVGNSEVVEEGAS